MTDTSLRINLDIMDFVEKQILPRYVNFDRAHNLSHVTSVMKRSIDLASKIGADVNMALVIAAYHDTGLEGPRAIHHLTGGKIRMADVSLCQGLFSALTTIRTRIARNSGKDSSNILKTNTLQTDI